MLPVLKMLVGNTQFLPALIEAVRAVAAAHPERIYKKPDGKGCSYTPSEQSDGTVSGCIISEAFARLGVNVNAYDNESQTAVGGILTTSGFDGDALQVRWLRSVQSQQDAGESWAGAVKGADFFYPLTVTQ